MQGKVSGNEVCEQNSTIQNTGGKTSEVVLPELIISPVVKKIQNYINKWILRVWRMDGDRQTATLNYEITIILETKPRTTPRNTS
jgi:hypothetical protein